MQKVTAEIGITTGITIMAKPIKRKLKSVHDPKMGSTSATVQRKQGSTKPAATPAASPKPKRAPKAKPAADLTAADKDFNNKRRKVLKDRKEGSKAGVTKRDASAQLAERLKAHDAAVAKAEKTASLQKTLQEKRKAVQNVNLKARQNATDANIKARNEARLKYMKAKKPVLKDGKVVTPKVTAPVYTPKKPKLKPMPRLENGKITYKPKVKHAPAAEDKAAGKQAAKTRKKSGPKAA